MHRSDGIMHATDAAPAELPFVEVVRSQRAQRAEIDGDDNNVYAAVDLSDGEVVLLGRRGGPEFLDSELARVGPLAALAVGTARP